MTRPTFAHIDLDALRHNFELVREYAPDQQVMAMLKADAYGHGAKDCALALAERTDAIAVAFIDEALALRQAGIKNPISLLQGVFDEQEIQLACEYELDLVILHGEQAQMLEQAELTCQLRIWLKFDSGMHRLGFSADEYAYWYERLRKHPNVAEVRLMTHFSCADEPDNPVTAEQEAFFDEVTQGLDTTYSLANSAAIMAWPSTRRDWVRPGIMLYGVCPFADWRENHRNLRPVMTLKSVVISTRTLQAGEAVGYGGSWVAPQNCRIGVVSIGYGDGYPRCLPFGTPVLIGGRRVSLVGRVTMDMITVDLTGMEDVKVGDEVTLWGEGLPVEEIAELANTIPYELLTGVSKRVPRLYNK
ncbi:MAG: alanine racemase [Pseudomonadales bacterium]